MFGKIGYRITNSGGHVALQTIPFPYDSRLIKCKLISCVFDKAGAN